MKNRIFATTLVLLSPLSATSFAQCPEVQKLLASDGNEKDEFGTSAAIEGDWLVVGADRHDAGTVYVHHHDQATRSWGSEQILKAADGQLGDSFGHAVSLSGTWLAISARGDDD